MKIGLLAVIFISIVSAQESDELQTDQDNSINSTQAQFLVSCEHPVLNKVRKEGLTSLTWKEVPFFLAMSIRCKFQAKQAGVDVPMEEFFQEKQLERHEEAKKISGLGSCCITVTGLIILYSFLGLALGGAK